ncbi:MAG TPA: hypothetical protein VM432_03395 [Bdellovibrionales bacterium]|nr:hypothetical protein [Bdellovibrionales bacterium]
MQSRTRQRLDELRLKLLRLHKILLDDEKEAYERIFGPVGGPGKLLGLVMSDPFFDWLHQISRLIVRIDEISENQEATDDMANACVVEAVSLISSDKDSEFGRRYKTALSRNVHAVAAHSAVLKAVHDD